MKYQYGQQFTLLHGTSNSNPTTIKIRKRQQLTGNATVVQQTLKNETAALVPITNKNKYGNNCSILMTLDERVTAERSRLKFTLACACLIIVVYLGVSKWYMTQESKFNIFNTRNGYTSGSFNDKRGQDLHIRSDINPMEILTRYGIYNKSTFRNEIGIIPPYWAGEMYDNNNTGHHRTPNHPIETTTESIGPCFLSKDYVNWTYEILRNQMQWNNASIYPTSGLGIEKNDWANYCLPGFLIIGAGKCGTSSLYHYLTDHPKILPASMKQIHYFKYYSDRPLKWYFSHFPTTTHFLSSGTMMTGEASPGYLPYPNVASMIRQRLPNGPKIIVVGREPVDRAYSSYRYNYVSPSIDLMKQGKMSGIRKGQPDSYYLDYLFSFEDLILAELNVLRDCLSIPNGSAVAGAKTSWSKKTYYKSEYERRQQLGMDPLVDLDGHCYGGPVNRTIIRKQWIDLFAKYPKKVMPSNNVHLTQAMIGRGLYTFPLEWWYAVFDKEEIYFVCTEELKDMTGEPLNKLGMFLGLHSFNYSNIVGRGAYNVGSHHGYDNEVSWSELETENPNNVMNQSDSDSASASEEIPLSDTVRSQLEDFVRPYNERLFELVGRRCNW